MGMNETDMIQEKEDSPELWKEPIPISHGDCGFKSEEEARENLGILKDTETWKEFQKAFDDLNKSTPASETIVMDSLPDLMETFEKEKTIEKLNDHFNDTFQPRNRAERRALEKATRRQQAKKKKMYVDNIKEAAQKLAYINMIEKVRELNKQIEEEGEIENEAAN